MPGLTIDIGADLSNFNAGMARVSRVVESVGKKIEKVGKSLSTNLTLPLVGLGTAAVASAVKFEKLNTSLEVLTGSAEEGAKAFERIKQFSAATPFQLGDLVSVNNQLMGFGLSADQAFDSLKMLGDVASVSGANLDRVAVAFGQSAAAGRVMTQDLNQFINNGIPIYQLLGDVTNKNVGELRDLASQGGITFDMLQEAFKKGTSEGGKFFEGTKKLSQTLGGQLSTLRDNFSLMIAEFGQVIGDALRPMITYLTRLFQRFKSLSPQVKKVVVIVTTLAAAIGPLMVAIGTLATTVIPALATAFTLLTGPIGLVVAALGSLTYIIIKNWSDVKTLIVQVVNGFIDLYNESVAFRLVVESLAAAFKTLLDVGVFVAKSLWSVIKGAFNNIINKFKMLGGIIAAAFKGDWDEIPKIIKDGAEKSKENIGVVISEILDEWGVLKEGIKKNIEDGVNNVETRKLKKITEDDIFDINFDFLTNLLGGPSGEKPTVKARVELEFDDISEAEFQEAMDEMMSNLNLPEVTPLEKGLDRIQKTARMTALAVKDAFSSMSSNIINNLGLADSGMQGFAKSLLSTTAEIISMALSNAVANAIVGGSQSALGTGPAAVFTQPAFISTAVGGVLSAFAAIPKFAHGGIFEGGTGSGDMGLARLNRGEMVLNATDQRGLFSMIKNRDNGGGNLSGGAYEFRLVGADLVGAVDRNRKRIQTRTRGY